MTISVRSFLVSFMVDARGGALRGSRHSGVRIIIPPKKAACPTRVTCRFLKREKLMHPPPLKEGEALAARVLEMGPVGTTFLGPVMVEVPHFASVRGKEREVIVMRSDDGETWHEHPVEASDEAISDALGDSFEDLEKMDDLHTKRVCRILTNDFPRYFAIVSRTRQEVCNIGPPGGVLSSTVVPQVQAVFSDGAVTKWIKVGLQAHPIPPELVVKLLGNRVAVSPVVTLEPRRRQFHKPITMTIPVPQAALKGMLNQYGDQTQAPTLRLLCSLVGGQQPAVWEDITKQTEMSFVNDCVQFMTAVSARFWLFDCQNVNESTRMATELYKESISVPFMAKFVVFAKRHAQEEGHLRLFCMTDDKVDKTLERQEHFVEVARSREVEVLEGKPQFMEMAGNLIPVTKSGDQLYINFRSFRENRLPCTVRVRDPDQDPASRVAFMKEPKVGRGDAPQAPICNLNVSLPDIIKSDSLELSEADALELKKRYSSLREHGIVLQDSVSRAQMKLSDVADTLQGDWVMLAQQLDITISDINRFKIEYDTVNDQALAMLHHWVKSNPDTATGNELEKSLLRINRGDVIRKCIFNVETVDDEVEEAAARVAMDQSGFDTLREEMGISRDSTMKRGISLEDEQDMVKESESAAEESSSETGSDKRRSVIEVEGFDVPSLPEIAEPEEHIEPPCDSADTDDFLLFAQEVSSESPDAIPYTSNDEKPSDDSVIELVSGRRAKASPTDDRPAITDKHEAYDDFINDLGQMLEDDAAAALEDRATDERLSTEEPPCTRGENHDHESVLRISDPHSLVMAPNSHEMEPHTTDDVDDNRIFDFSDQMTRDDLDKVAGVPPEATDAVRDYGESLAFDVIDSSFHYLSQPVYSSSDALQNEDSLAEALHLPDSPTDDLHITNFPTEDMHVGDSPTDDLHITDCSIDELHITDCLTEDHHTAADTGHPPVDEGRIHHEEKKTPVDDVFAKMDEMHENHTGPMLESTPLEERFDEMGVRDGLHSPGETADSPRNEDNIVSEGPEQQRRDVQHSEEMLDDGTIVKTQKIHTHSVKCLKKRISSDSGEDIIVEEECCIPGTERDELIKVFEEPPRHQTLVEDVEHPANDGNVVKKQMIHNRMVQRKLTRRHSVDAIQGEQNEEFEVDEIIPGTESSFLKGSSSEDEDENEEDKPRKRHMSRETIIYKLLKEDGTVVRHHKEIYPDKTYTDIIEEQGVPIDKEDIENFEEILPDGTIHHTQILHKHQVRKVVKRVESTDVDTRHIFEGEVEVPNTSTREVISTSDVQENNLGYFGIPEADEDVTHVLPSGHVIHRQVRRERLKPGDIVDKGRDDHIQDLLDAGTTKKYTDHDEMIDYLNDGSEITHRHTIIDEISTVRSRSGSPELVTDRITILEQELAPSPRGSPFGSLEDLREMDLRQDQNDYVLRKVKKTLLSETIKGDEVHEAYSEAHHTYDRRNIHRADEVASESTPTITITEDNTTPCDEDDYVNFYGLDPTKQEKKEEDGPEEDGEKENGSDHHSDDSSDSSDEHDIDEPVEEDKVSSSSSDVARLDEVAFDKDQTDDLSSHHHSPPRGDEDMDSTRVTMKKEVHTRTVLDKEGATHTTVTEETSIEEDTEGGNELRGSMQQIIDDFMGGDAQHPHVTQSDDLI